MQNPSSRKSGMHRTEPSSVFPFLTPRRARTCWVVLKILSLSLLSDLNTGGERHRFSVGLSKNMIKYHLHSNHSKADSKWHGWKMFSSRARGDLMVPLPCRQHNINWTSQSRWVFWWAIQQKGWFPTASVSISSNLQCLIRTISHQLFSCG